MTGTIETIGMNKLGQTLKICESEITGDYIYTAIIDDVEVGGGNVYEEAMEALELESERRELGLPYSHLDMGECPF